MKIAVSSDHRGYQAKERIKKLLQESGHEVQDFGTDGLSSCDYPDMAIVAAKAVAAGECDRGVLICGTGIGMSIAANKVHKVRAALCHDELTAQLARKHNDANILCLPADLVGEQLIKLIIHAWLTSEFEGGRHARRLDKITEFENNGQCD